MSVVILYRLRVEQSWLSELDKPKYLNSYRTLLASLFHTPFLSLIYMPFAFVMLLRMH